MYRQTKFIVIAAKFQYVNDQFNKIWCLCICLLIKPTKSEAFSKEEWIIYLFQFGRWILFWISCQFDFNDRHIDLSNFNNFST